MKTNYVEWPAVMRVRLQVRHMWEAVRYGDVDYDEDRRALDALITAVPPEMQFSLSQKQTVKEAWDAVAAARIGSDRARKSTLQALRKECENLAFKLGEDIDDFALRLNTLLQKMVQYGDDTYGDERAVEKLLRCVPDKYKQIARSIESLLDLSRMSIEEAIGHLKVVDSDESQPPSGPVIIGGKLHFTQEQWEARQGDRKKGEPSSLTGGRRHGKPRKAPKPRRGQAHVALAEEEEPALLLAHASIELTPAASAVAVLLHLDEPRAHAFLGDGSSNDRTEGWCLDTDATQHMTGRREFFTELDSSVRGTVKFGDASSVEIKGVGSVIFTAESGEHRLLTGVYYIPALRNSIISLGQLEENGSRVVIDDGVMRIWDRRRCLLAKVTRGANRLYILNVQVAQPFCLAARQDDKAWQWHERFGHLHFEALKRLSAKEMQGEAADAIRRTQAAVEANCGRKLRVLRTDNGGEFTAVEFALYCADEGIQRHYFAPYSPQQNGVVERRN
ncbi:uncharacterized protein LOC105914958 [Setaria italica]|uniref:uncharacterized protein LOC105914958 n=1 Tax=Setaria italica TaxID=4555 RepID=UPI000645A125|nr:uncharacterized protein LOC105914958 [Setaria italica]